MVPLLSGTAILQLFLWRRRNVLAEHFRRNVPIGILLAFAGGFGLGLLVASAFSLFFWWWTIGAILLLFVFFIVLSIIAK
jgi:ABC-type phosphate/phosphonate transport system permease subunit